MAWFQQHAFGSGDFMFVLVTQLDAAAVMAVEVLEDQPVAALCVPPQHATSCFRNFAHDVATEASSMRISRAEYAVCGVGHMLHVAVAARLPCGSVRCVSAPGLASQTCA